MTLKFNISFEEDILAQVLSDADYLKKATRVLDAHHFSSPQHAWVWKIANDIWKHWRELAQSELMKAKARVDYSDDDERDAQIQLLRKLYRRKPKAPRSTLEALEKFVRAVNAQIALETAAKELERGNVDAVYEGLKELSSSAARLQEYTHSPWIERFELRQRDRLFRRLHPEQFTRVPTGFKRLDALIEGLEVGELGLVVALTSVGKSIMLANLCYHAVRTQHPSVYFTLEMPERQISQRFDSRWLGIPYKKFKMFDFSRDELESIERRLERIKPKFNNMLHVVQLPMRKANMDTIRDALEDLRTEHNFTPKAIFIDSADHLRGVGRFENYRLEQSEVYWDCAALALEGYGVWSSTQARKDTKKQIVDAEDTSESYDKARIADVILSLNIPKQETRSTKVISDGDDDAEQEAIDTNPRRVKGKYLKLFLAKYRDGESKVTIPLDAEFDRILIRELEDEI